MHFQTTQYTTQHLLAKRAKLRRDYRAHQDKHSRENETTITKRTKQQNEHGRFKSARLIESPQHLIYNRISQAQQTAAQPV